MDTNPHDGARSWSPSVVEAVLERIKAKGQQGRVVVAIDGRSGAGKTTLAEALAYRCDANLIHMDDFFLPPALRTAQRLAQPGGNIHYERLQEQVIRHLRGTEPFTYGVFDCTNMSETSQRRVVPRPVTILEGAYALHPHFGDVYDLRIFCDIGPEEQKRRIVTRNGPVAYRDFAKRWIPMEELYLTTFGIEACCDMILREGAL